MLKLNKCLVEAGHHGYVAKWEWREVERSVQLHIMATTQWGYHTDVVVVEGVACGAYLA